MAAAIFYDPATGIVTHFVTTEAGDPPNALQPHLDAAKASGLAVLQVAKLPAGQAVFDAVTAVTGKSATAKLAPAPAPDAIESASTSSARKSAFDNAIAQGKDYSDAMTAGQSAAVSAMTVDATPDATPATA